MPGELGPVLVTRQIPKVGAAWTADVVEVAGEEPGWSSAVGLAAATAGT